MKSLFLNEPSKSLYIHVANRLVMEADRLILDLILDSQCRGMSRHDAIASIKAALNQDERDCLILDALIEIERMKRNADTGQAPRHERWTI